MIQEKLTEYQLLPNELIYDGDTIIRRSTSEISEANDEWYGDLHDDWCKAIKIS